MKNNKLILSCISLCLLTGLYSCKKDAMGILNTGGYDNMDTSGTLKSIAGFPIGFAAYMGDAGFSKYFPIIAKEGNNITPGNEMKYGSVVRNDGSLNFVNADNLVSQASAAGLQVFGHTLMWHSQQNTTYLKSIAGDGVAVIPNIITNGGFEAGTGDPYGNNWSSYTGKGTLTRNVVADPALAHKGNNVAVLSYTNKPAGVNNYEAQFNTRDNYNFNQGTTYVVTAWVKATEDNNTVQLELQDAGYSAISGYSGDISVGKSWTPIVWRSTANKSAAACVRFDVGKMSGTFYIDDVTLCTAAEYDAAQSAAGGTATAARVDSVLKLWILGNTTTDGIVKHYAGKVFAWDVANEVLTDGGAIRTSQNTTVPSGATGYFFWADYLGKDGIVNAFKYAKQADPNAALFINDFNLETSKIKTDSIVSLVKYIKDKGAQIDGIGTQMHVNVNINRAGIDYMFEQLASTGLKIRISELDIQINPLGKVGYVPFTTDLALQADLYSYIVQSYLKHVPAAQRHGITVWGVDDANSWRYNNGSDYLLLWDKDFRKKPAYAAFYNALKESK